MKRILDMPRSFFVRHLLVSCFSLTFLMSTFALPASAEEPAKPSGLGDEMMLFQEIPSVYGASKYEQKVTEAPSSVSIITSSDIKKFGYRNLADILKSVRGFYMTYDRNYSYAGIRGFNRPGDFNTRVLLLVDGHRTNDNIYDQAFIGTEFILDIDLIDRIEIIRGPSSSLYGSNAFFGIVNVITKRGRDLSGAEVSAEAGSFETYKGRLSYGNKFSNGLEMLLSGTLYESRGDKHLYYREFDAPETNNGVAEKLDGDEYKSAFGKLSYRDFVLSGAYISREKDVPTAAYGTVFNSPNSNTQDTRKYIDLRYQHAFENQWDVMARLYYDNYRFSGTYMFDQALEDEPTFLVKNKDVSKGDWWGAEAKVSKRLSVHNLTLGSEYVMNRRQDQKNYDQEPYYEYLDDDRDSKNWAVYFQDEISVLKNLILNAGVRYDHYDTFGGNTSPRVALIYNPVEKTTFKLLYGEAFRAPNANEQYYQDGGVSSKANPDLDPEKIKTYELVYDQYLGDHLLMTVAGFYYKIQRLISQEVDPADELITYQNTDEIKARGIEIELDGSWENGIEGRISYTYQKTEDNDDKQLTNSPEHLVKLNVVVPVIREKLLTGLEVLYTSKRKTIAGNSIGDYVVANLTVYSQKLLKGLTASASIYNIFDEKYDDPGSAEHVQDTIEQDGRSFRVKLTYAF